MNKRQSLYDIQEFYKKGAVLKASFQGMRYQVEMVKEEEESHLLATIWPEPYCFEKTPEEEKEAKEFPATEEGLDEVHQWLTHSYDNQKERWQEAAQRFY